MSHRLVNLVLEHYPAGGGECMLAIAIADESSRADGTFRADLDELARYSRLKSTRQVRRLLQKMEASGWLQCLERTKGGSGKMNVYRINPDWVRLPIGFQFGRNKPGHNPDILSGFVAEKPGHFVRVSGVAPLSLKTLPPIVPQTTEPVDGSAVPSAVTADQEAGEDARLARWMFSKIQELHPRHREPNWKRWCREIRLLRQSIVEPLPDLAASDCDDALLEANRKRRREIADVFSWANADREPRPGSTFCWATAILSPNNLKKHWDRLVIASRSATPAKPAAPDALCSECHTRAWSVMLGKSGPHVCRQCAAELETE